MAPKPDLPSTRNDPVPASAASGRVPSSTPWPDHPLLWPFAATGMAVNACLWWLDRDVTAPEGGGAPSPDWTTPNTVALELPTLRLRDFSRGASGSAALICAPYALHRALVADFAPGHSIVEALQRGGVEAVYVTDWRSASSDMRYLAIDNYLADLNVAVDAIGPPCDLIGLCQGGWMSLLYAARFPEKVRRLVLVGAPVDVSVESELSRLVAQATRAAFEAVVTSGGGVVRGSDLMRLWRADPDIETVLQRSMPPDDVDAQGLRARFAQWHAETLDLPGVFYLETVEKIFRENRLAKGTFVALGRPIDLAKLTTPLFILAGNADEVVPPAQAMATAALLGTPPALVASEIAPCTHLGLFVGRTVLTGAWRRIAEWLAGADPATIPARLASG